MYVRVQITIYYTIIEIYNLFGYNIFNYYNDIKQLRTWMNPPESKIELNFEGTPGIRGDYE